MVKSSKDTHSVTIDGISIPANTYRDLLKFVLSEISNGNDKDSIKKSLTNAGWPEGVIDFLYSLNSVVPKDNLLTKKEIESHPDLSNESTDYADKDEISRLETEFQNTLKEVSKFEGKLEAGDTKFAGYDEKISVVRDTMSEVRGMVMASEKRLSSFETNIEKVNSVIADFDPTVLEKKFSNLEKQVTISESNNEKVEAKLKDIEVLLKQYLDFMKKIKSYESLVSNLDALTKKRDKLEDVKKDIDKKAGKIENIYLEFEDKLEDLMKVKNKVVAFDEIIKDLIRDSDTQSTQMGALLKKEDFAKKFAEYVDELETVKSVVYDLSQGRTPTQKISLNKKVTQKTESKKEETPKQGEEIKNETTPVENAESTAKGEPKAEINLKSAEKKIPAKT